MVTDKDVIVLSVISGCTRSIYVFQLFVRRFGLLFCVSLVTALVNN